MGFRVKGSGFRVWGLGFRVLGLGFKFGVECLGLRVSGFTARAPRGAPSARGDGEAVCTPAACARGVPPSAARGHECGFGCSALHGRVVRGVVLRPSLQRPDVDRLRTHTVESPPGQVVQEKPVISPQMTDACAPRSLSPAEQGCLDPHISTYFSHTNRVTD